MTEVTKGHYHHHHHHGLTAPPRGRDAAAPHPYKAASASPWDQVCQPPPPSVPLTAELHLLHPHPCFRTQHHGSTMCACAPSGPQSHYPLQAHVLQSPAPWLLHMYPQLRHRATTTTREPVPWTLELPTLYEHLCSRSQICH